MQFFKISKNITLKLENNDTVIYIAGERFIQCKYLLINISADTHSFNEEIGSMDEVCSILNHSLEPFTDKRGELQRLNKMNPETEFFGHCSNLQAWYEHNYDTRLLDKSISFPILKRLAEIGDGQAEIVIKEEIVKRIKSGFVPTIEFLLNEGYLLYLTDQELTNLLLDLGTDLYNILEQLIIINAKAIMKSNYIRVKLAFLERLPIYFQKNIIKELFKRGDLHVIFYLAYDDLLNLFDIKELLKEIKFNLLQTISEMILYFGNTGGFLEYLKSSERFSRIIKGLYQTGEPEVFYFLDHEGYSNSISRKNYYKYLLVKEEAEAMVELEKLLNEKYWLGYDQKSLSECEFIVKNKHIIELVVNSNLVDLPNPIRKFYGLKKLYLFMPNLKITKNDFKKLKSSLERFEYKFQKIKKGF